MSKVVSLVFSKVSKDIQRNIEIVHVTIYPDCLIGICAKSRRNSSASTEEIYASPFLDISLQIGCHFTAVNNSIEGLRNLSFF